ncbi:MAG: hypothetical protein ACREQC_16740, partial [Candidatus Binataceae bacterium]
EVEGISPERAIQVIHAAREWVASKLRLEEERAQAAAAAAAQAAIAAESAPPQANDDPAFGAEPESAGGAEGAATAVIDGDAKS